MFDNIGGKIKGLANTLCWIGIIASIIGGIGMFVAAANTSWQYQSTYITMGVVIITVGSLVSWVGSFMLYGFGELIDRANSIDHKLAALNTLLNNQQFSSPDATTLQQPERPKQQSEPKDHSTNLPQSVVIAPSATKPEPAIKDTPAKAKHISPDAYDDVEIQILKSLLEEGKISEEEYQKCMSGMNK